MPTIHPAPVPEHRAVEGAHEALHGRSPTAPDPPSGVPATAYVEVPIVPTNLPPLPPQDDSWPPRPCHPATVEEIRAALRAYDSAHDMDAAVHRIIRAFRRHRFPGGSS